jgi:hypothetical protein
VQQHGGNLVPSTDISPAAPHIVQQSAPDQEPGFDISSVPSQADDIPGNPPAVILILDAHAIEQFLLAEAQILVYEKAVGRCNPCAQRPEKLFDAFSHVGLFLVRSCRLLLSVMVFLYRTIER